MSKEKETEKIISDKLNSREFAFDENAWAGMETLLDAQEKKRRRAAFWYFSASMLVVLVVGGTYFYKLKVSSQKSEVSVTSSVVEKLQSTIENQELKANSHQLTAKNEQTPAILEQKQEKLAEKTRKEAISGQSNRLTPQSNRLTLQSNQSTPQSNLSTLQSNQSTPQANQSTLQTNQSTPQANQSTLQTNQLPLQTNQSTPQENQSSSKENQSSIETIQAESLKKDSVSLAENINETKNPLAAPGKETKNAWGIIAGAGYWLPYKSTFEEINRKGVIGFTGGIYYQRTLTTRMQLGVSLVYSSRGALNYNKTFIASDYGFGVNSDKTIVSPQTLHYLSVPLYVRFNISQRSHLVVGASYYHLLATTSKITHTTENSFGVLESSSEKQTGENKGFRKNDIAAFVGYELTLFDHMNAGLQFSYGFFDITNNNYNNGGKYKIDHNICIQLHLKYDLIRH